MVDFLISMSGAIPQETGLKMLLISALMKIDINKNPAFFAGFCIS